LLLVVAVKTRGPDDASVAGVACDESAARLQRLLEEVPKDPLLVAVPGRMLLPDQRIRGHGEKRVEIRGEKRSQFEKLAFQDGLEIERHLACQRGLSGALGATPLTISHNARINSNSRTGNHMTRVTGP